MTWARGFSTMTLSESTTSPTLPMTQAVPSATPWSTPVSCPTVTTRSSLLVHDRIDGSAFIVSPSVELCTSTV